MSLGPGSSPEDFLFLSHQTDQFMRDTTPLSDQAAISLLGNALETGSTSIELIERHLTYQSKSLAESAAKTFDFARSDFVGSQNVLHSLRGRAAIPPTRKQVMAFQGTDLLRGARLLEGLKRTQLKTQVEVFRELAGLAPPMDVEAQHQFLVKAGYLPLVAKRLVEDAPHLADAIIRAAREGLKLPEHAKENWEYLFPGGMAFEPVTLWRGIDAQQFDPHRRVQFKTEAGREFSFLSTDVRMAFMRSVWSYTGGNPAPGRTHGVLVKYQVPKFLAMKTDNSHAALIQKMVPDQGPLVAAIAKIPFTPIVEKLSDIATLSDINELTKWEPPNPSVVKAADPSRPPAPLEVSDPLSWAKR